MPHHKWLLLSLTLAAALVVIVIATAALIPQQTHPAFDAAVSFANAAARGDEATAAALVSDELRAYAAENCPDESVSACVLRIIPAEWGGFVSAVFRRAAPDGEAWDVDLIATYERAAGGSGVCIYTRVEPAGDGSWQITRWAGWAWCGDPATRSMATNPDAPNRAP